MTPFLKRAARQVLPPIVVRGLSAVNSRLNPQNRPEWEYVPEGWARQDQDNKIKGWNAPGVLQASLDKWENFGASVTGNGVLGLAHESESSQADILAHNTNMCYAYVLALSASSKERISILDWGGGIGHYYLLSKAILPGTQIDYHCKDLSLMVEKGRELLPDARFYDDETCLERQYDLVLSSSSIQYSPNWQETMQKLASVAQDYLYMTLFPTVLRHPSFVVVQRPYAYGYGTEYLGWFLNRQEVVSCIPASDMRLVREFLMGHAVKPHNAPEAGVYRGFLFQRELL